MSCLWSAQRLLRGACVTCGSNQTYNVHMCTGAAALSSRNGNSCIHGVSGKSDFYLYCL